MTLRTLLGFAWPHRASLALCLALMLVETAAALMVPWLGGKFAAGVLASGGLDVSAILLGLLALFALQGLIKVVGAVVLSRSTQRILADLRVAIYDHLQALPLGFHQQRRHGDLLALLTHEVAHLSGFLTGPLLRLVPQLLTAAGAVLLMLSIEASLGLLVVVLIPLFFLGLKVTGRRLRPLAAALQQAEAQALATAEENLRLLPLIKAFTREETASQRHARDVHRVMDVSITQQRLYALIEPVIGFLASAAVLLVLWFASARLSDGGLRPEALISFLLYAGLLTRPVSALSGLYGETQRARGALAHLRSVLAEPPEALWHGATLARPRGDIEVRHVSFAYPGRAPALKGLSFTIRAGETVALTGPNGAGKSTLAHLLMRFYAPDSGKILIDGVDIAGLCLNSLRRHIAVVPQQVLLFNASIRDNIALAKTEATASEIECAARVAQADGFIQALPHGYDTVIGDHGIRLSGGQRQRIALARALLKAAPILILDEATAMFDPAGEAAFVAACRERRQRQTLILITHRPASLALADRVARLEAGGLVWVPSAPFGTADTSFGAATGEAGEDAVRAVQTLSS